MSWDERYSADELAYGDKPNDFLREEEPRLPAGRALCLAEGQGRNAVYLAEKGRSVTAVDSSAVGMERARALAGERDVTIETVVGDLADYDLGDRQWDLIVSIFAHVPSALRRTLYARAQQALKPGGMILIEAYTPDQHKTSGKGGPPPGEEDKLVTLAALRDELAGLEEVIGREIEREVNEGPWHHGTGAVVQFVGRKPAGKEGS